MRSPGYRCAPVLGPCAALALLALVLATVACATGAPAPPTAGTGTAWGYLKLVPHEGVTPVKPGASPYADRRMRDVEFVDYSKPGFAVVHLDSGPSPRGSAALEIRTTGVRTRLDPPQVAVGAGGSVVVTNSAATAHVLSAPALGFLRRLEPGEHAEIALPNAGEQSLFLLDVPRSEATLFVSPGPFVVVSADGRFELSGLAPGHYAVMAWHPRFPPVRASLDLAADQVVRLDLEMGVDQGVVYENAPANLP
jgi:hypothetical protein